MAKRVEPKTKSKRPASKKKTRKTAGASAKKSTQSSRASRKKTGKRTTSNTTGRNRSGAQTAADKNRKSTVTKTTSRTKKDLVTPVGTRKKMKVRASRSNSKLTADTDRQAATQDPIQFPQAPGKIPKTHLTAKELKEFKLLLLDKRSELADDVQHLSDEMANRRGQGGTEHSAMPIHMADLGSDNWEQEFTLGLIANERDRIIEIDEALARIESKTYGVCLATHRKISRARLLAKPWAKYCIDYARAREEGRAL